MSSGSKSKPTSSSDTSVKKVDFKQLASSQSASSHKRIESPLAKYNSIGQLTCIICNQVVKSELVWNAHLNSKTHLENKNNLRLKLLGEKDKPANGNKSDDTKQASKRSINQSETKEDSKDETDANLNIKKQKLDKLIKKTDSISLNNTEVTEKEKKPADETPKNDDLEKPKEETSEPAFSVSAESLPEGFFDDPDQDAKVRGISKTENLEAEYEMFKKMIQTEEFKSDVIVEKDDIISNIERELDEVDELIVRWSKIENLHQQREALIEAAKIKKSNEATEMQTSRTDDEEDDEDVDLDNILNMTLRSKKIL